MKNPKLVKPKPKAEKKVELANNAFAMALANIKLEVKEDNVVDANNKTVGVYVNITTGNLIGAIAGI